MINMKKYRCRHDIIYDLLYHLSREFRVVKTRLCSYANLPLDRCDELLTHLESHGLITKIVDRGRVYVLITDRGYIYIGLYEQLKRIID